MTPKITGYFQVSRGKSRSIMASPMLMASARTKRAKAIRDMAERLSHPAGGGTWLYTA